MANTTFNIVDSGAAKDAVKKYTTFSGSDIKAAFNNIEIGNLQGLSVSVNRETRPIFVMGEENAVSFSKGKRGIAGSLILSTFDRHALGYVLSQAKVYSKTSNGTLAGDRSAQLTGGTGQVEGDLDTALNQAAITEALQYADQLPPFNITLVARNSFGHAMRMVVEGVNLISEGMGISIDDATQESQLTFVCTGVKWWTPIA